MSSFYGGPGIQGIVGDRGQIGPVPTISVVSYGVNTTTTTAPTEWTATVPTIPSGYYLWNRLTFVQDSGTKNVDFISYHNEHPQATDTTLGAVKLGYTIATGTSALQLTDEGRAYVSVPIIPTIITTAVSTATDTQTLSAKAGYEIYNLANGKPNILYGTTVPTAEQGQDGDLYILLGSS